MSSPRLSVVIPAYRAAGTIFQCLSALERQSCEDFEVLVVSSGEEDTDRLVAERFPEVRRIRSRERRFPGGARNLGIAKARAELLAFTDADCVPDGTWVESLIAAHELETPVIGGVIANGNPGRRTGWAYYLVEFHRWAPGADAGFVDDLPGCCWSMKRWAFDRYGPFVEGTYCSDTIFHWRMARDGLRPYLDPGVRVSHLNPVGLGGILRHERMHGRSFARVRAAEHGWGRSRAALHAATTPLLPFLLLGRIVAGAGARRLTRRLLQTLPLVAASVASWSAGELEGYAGRVLAPSGIESP